MNYIRISAVAGLIVEKVEKAKQAKKDGDMEFYRILAQDLEELIEDLYSELPLS